MIRFAFLILFFIIIFPSTAQTNNKTENVVIVTLDGYRWRELFDGADRTILFKKKYVKDTSVQSKFWRETAQQRRAALMPFFWKVIEEKGQLYGNRKFDNGVSVANKNFYSYSGYAEMFVGFADKQIKNNDPKPNPNSTVFEALQEHKEFRNSIAAFSTWQTMTHILREEQSGIPVNSGGDKADGKNLSARERRLNRLTEHHKNPHGDRFDRFTFQYAMEYMKRKKPRVTFISFDETDEHAHDGRYDEYLKAAHAADKMISDLWNWLQSDDQYRGKTTLIITTDHGRGTSAKGWKHHRLLYRGSAQTWIAVLGPDTPAEGELKNFMRLKQSQIAKTIAAFLDQPYENVRPVGDVITTAFKAKAAEEGISTVSGAE